MLFNEDMYITAPGSLIISFFILCRDKMPSLHFIKQRWLKYRELVLRGNDPIKDSDYVAGLCKYFKLPIEEKPNIVLVESKFNKLFMPYVVMNGENIILPLKEDGTYSQTYYKAANITDIKWTV